jgi:tetratricopeptide (TPR) repeat protein
VIRRLLLATLLLACSSQKGPNPIYAPTESIIEVISVLRLHINDDTYRFPPARDVTGKNIYSAVLSRAESLEQLHAEKLRSGYMVDVLLFAKGRALERMTEYELAAHHYKRVLDLDSPLGDSAYMGRAVCERLREASEIEISAGVTPGEAMAAFDRRLHLLEQLADEVEGTHYTAVVQEEIERADRARAEYFAARAVIEPWLDVIALQQYQHLVQRHSESKNRNRQDGAVEKIEAARKLEAFLAFTLQVYDEKLPR